jgi:mannose-6-phosphate isomerase-like protein (cupin superfamily)
MQRIDRLLSVEGQTARLAAQKARHGAPPWSEPLMFDDVMEAFLIHQPPGHPNDTHYHKHVEWWVILEGELAWWFEGDPEPHRVEAGDFVFGPPFRWHHIQVLGTEPATRIAIRHRGEFHRYDRPGCGPAGSPEQWRPE